MKRLFIILFIGIELILLSACKLVVERETTTKTAENNTINHEVYALKILPKDGETEYYVYRYLPGKPDSFDTSTFLNGVHINVHVGESTTETIELNYYFNLDQPKCFNLVTILIDNNEELSEGKGMDTCGKEKISLIEETENKKTEFIINFIDVDYLESYRVIQFDELNNKIADDFIPLEYKEEEVNITIKNNTEDFIIERKYVDSNNNVYYDQSLHGKDELLKQYSPFQYDYLFALTALNDRIQYKFTYNLEEQGGEL